MMVLEALSRGLADHEIAHGLGITEFTVNKHVGAILLKMNVRSRTAAAIHAIRKHIVP
jgi:DNA-binding NarL/FixJ family response regulator